MNLTEQLLKQASLCEIQTHKLKADAELYHSITLALPRTFPAPDDVYLNPTDMEANLVLVYDLKKTEQDDALRMILDITFGATKWEGEIVADSEFITLRSLVNRQGYSILIKIMGANASHYSIENLRDFGLKCIGDIKCTTFVPWEIKRPDVTPQIIFNTIYTTNTQSYIAHKQSQILKIIADALPVDLPCADGILVDLGLTYDVDIVYLCDSKGKKRKYIDKHLGYNGWSAAIDKVTADFNLYTIFEIECELGILRVRVSILEACKSKEMLFLVMDAPKTLIYRATQPSDPDHNEVLKLFKVKYGH